MEQSPESSQNLDQALSWFSKGVSTALSIVILWPVTTVLASVTVVGLVVFICIMPSMRPDKPPPPNEWRLQQMMNAVQAADQRVREKIGPAVEPDAEYRGVFETMRDQPALSENQP